MDAEQTMKDLSAQIEEILESCKAQGPDFRRLVMVMFEVEQLAMLIGQLRSMITEDRHAEQANRLGSIAGHLMTCVIAKTAATVDESLLGEATRMADVLFNKRLEAMERISNQPPKH